MKRSWVALAAALIGSGASGQTTTTLCQSYTWGNIQCASTTPQPLPPVQTQPQSSGYWGLIGAYPNAGQSFSNSFQQGIEQRRLQEQLGAQPQSSTEQPSGAGQQDYARPVNGMPLPPPDLQGTPMPADMVQAMRQAAADNRAKEAGKMMAAGDCTGAEAYALKAGDLTLAKQVKDYCGK